MFARICIDRTFVRRLVRELWHDLLTLIAVAGDLDFSEDKTAPHVTAWQLVGSIYTTDSAAGPDKLRQKAMMAKPTAISLACWYCCHAQLINSCLASVFA